METRQKHAYLIMAHNNFDQLKTLVSLLDDIRNDIYLQVDKKATIFRPESINTKHAGLFFVEPMSVTWGGHSLIACKMRLLKNAAPKHYAYYHIISGLDLPLKSQDEIHAFFQNHFPQNFIEFDQEAMRTRSFVDRTQYYYFFQNIIGRSNRPLMAPLKILERISLKTQKILHMKRKEIVPTYKGSNWVSVTDEMAQYILSCEKIIKKQFFFAYCADEGFLHSIAMHSPYRDTIVDDSCRAIDWQRGFPYTYRKEDVPELLASEKLFARKFDCNVDAEAIRLVAEHLSGDDLCK